jgi:phospholipid/cholesterol/gamma-HCH transport system ATP-binding protein
MIRFEGVCKRFGEKVVLDNFTLDVPEGQTTVIIGASGSGKSVALKHVVGLLEPDAGRVEVDGLVVHELDWEALSDLRARIGFVFQFAALFDSMTVEENIRLGLERRRQLSGADISARVTESLRLVGLTEQHRPPLSSGGCGSASASPGHCRPEVPPVR